MSCASGATFTNHTLTAGWAGRYAHTSVIDAISGAIYVIGGRGTTNSGTYYHDVWASTDGGVRAGLSQGAVGGVVRGYSGVPRG